MQFYSHDIKTEIRRYVESIFYFKGYSPDHSIERVVPNGHVHIVFELDNKIRHTYENDHTTPNATFSKVWMSGMKKSYISISAPKDSEMLVIQFKPYGPYPFIHRPVSQLNDQIINFEGLTGLKLEELRESILSSDTAVKKFGHVESWLENRFEEKRQPPDILVETVKKVQQAPGARLEAVIAEYPKTKKHLISQFKKYVGPTPKYFQRIMRFNDILTRLKNEDNITWTQVAYACGFADQSHFIKEFKQFSGFKPNLFVEKDHHNKEPNFSPWIQKVNFLL